jgi:hypothetical protein
LQEVMLPVISAERILQFNVLLIFLFISGFVSLFQSATKQRKNNKWYVVVIVISIIVFIVWNILAHNSDAIRKVLAIDKLADSWRETFTKRFEKLVADYT